MVHLITLDPAHFHAALVQKEMYAGVSPVVTIYAPLGLDLTEHLTRVARFNQRAAEPTCWELNIHTGPNFLDRMLAEQPAGSAVVLSGRNRAKIERIERSVAKGFHVLADKPWILRSVDLPRIEAALDAADQQGIVAYDMMTERYEITSILHRALVNTPQVFGALLSGTADEPAVFMDSMHRLIKTVGGFPMLRPVDFFDIEDQGEALNDVGTHLVDLAQWIAFPDQALDYRTDIAMHGARRWPTVLAPDQWRQVTGGASIPGSLSSFVKDGNFHYYGNNFVSYSIRGIHVHMNVRWDLEGVSDTYVARFRGSQSSIEVRQGEAENFRPEVYVVPNAGQSGIGQALEAKLKELHSEFPGLGVEEISNEFRIAIPDQYRVGHEAHFGEVTRQFFAYLDNPKAMPAWEKPNMLAKYYVSTKGVEMAAQPS
ncbi:MAG: putative oxidoreductase C-terminal domain-containing protein [Bryobacteraceae bacterium]